MELEGQIYALNHGFYYHDNTLLKCFETYSRLPKNEALQFKAVQSFQIILEKFLWSQAQHDLSKFILRTNFMFGNLKASWLRQCIQEMNHAIRKMPKFQLISWYGNFVETADRFAQNPEGIIRFHKISTTGNWVKFRYSMQWWDHASKIWLTRNHDSYKILNVTELKFTESPSFFRINIINSFVYQANLYNSFVLCHIYHNQIQANLLNEWKFEIQLIEI